MKKLLFNLSRKYLKDYEYIDDNGILHYFEFSFKETLFHNREKADKALDKFIRVESLRI